MVLLGSRNELNSGKFLFKAVVLYDYTEYNVCSAWFLDIVISTCLQYEYRAKYCSLCSFKVMIMYFNAQNNPGNIARNLQIAHLIC